jgi:hypothetical protein
MKAECNALLDLPDKPVDFLEGSRGTGWNAINSTVLSHFQIVY